MLIPSRTKYRRVHRLKYEGKAKGNTHLTNGEYGLMAKEGAGLQIIKSKQLVLL